MRIARGRTKAAVTSVLILAAAMIAAHVPAASADVTAQPGAVVERGGYDYAPSIIEENGVRKIWWCGQTSVGSAGTDAIFYREQNIATGALSAVQRVLAPSVSGAEWDRSYICDPSVVKGSFLSPDDGQTYSYALYYTATDRGPGWSGHLGPLDGTNNRIGVAWSNDGVTWKRYSQNPVVYPQNYPTDTYGAGQAATFNTNGSADIWITHHDNSVAGTGLWRRTSGDGRTFSTATSLSVTGLAPTGEITYGSNFDVAFDPAARQWYGAFPLPIRAGQRETYRIVLARMSEATYPGGTWEKLGYIDTNLTGRELNHSPGIARDGFGSVAGATSGLRVLYATGTNDPGSWDLVSATWSPTPATKPLLRAYNSTTARHLVTTGVVQTGFSAESTLGYLVQSPANGTVPLFGCRAGGGDNFLSLQEDCEGTYALGVNGYIYSAPPAAVSTAPVYRCLIPSAPSHFVSLDPNCEGTVTEQLLGYVRTAA